MSRLRSRPSRALIAILAAVLALGLVFYFHNTSHSKAGNGEVAPAAAQHPTAVSANQNAAANAAGDARVAGNGNSTNGPSAAAAPAANVPTGAALITQIPPAAPGSADAGGAGTSIAAMHSPTTRPAMAMTNTVVPSRGGAADANAADLVAAINRPAQVLSSDPIADGRARIQSGDGVGGRQILNAALVAGVLSAADQATAKQLIADANRELIFSPHRFTGDPFVTTHKVLNGESLSQIAFKYEVTWEFLCRINGISDPRRLRAGQTLKIVQGPFSAVVNRGAFTIDVWLGQPMGRGSLYVTTYRVGLGREHSTPTGTWMVKSGGKLKNPKFWGAGGMPPIEADDPKNPLGEFWIGLEGVDGNAVGQESYGIHGTIEPDSIGKMASLGCIRMLNDDVAVLYEMLVEGKSIVVVRD